jgi:hypothetical protein
MGILALKADERVNDVSFTSDTHSVSLKDGRTITVPLAWYPKLFHAFAGPTQKLEDFWRRLRHSLA